MSGSSAALIVISVMLTLLLIVVWRRQMALRREAYIRSFDLPRGLFDRLTKQHPGLTRKQCELVAHGLRQFFLAYLKSGKQFVSMPSQIADDLWHEFILFTRHYEAFCRRAFGGFMHHTPAVALTSARQSNVGLRRCWWHVCREENINPKAPTRLPLLFALDAKLDVPNGFVYAADCEAVRRRRKEDGADVGIVYCGGDFSSDSFDGGTDGFGDGDSAGDGGDGGGDGCGGGGCGGGGD